MTLTEQQRRAITTLGKHLCVDAGAGSGKTRVLVGRIVHILEERKAELPEIVAITFTRKAAAEMKERLRAAFHAKAPPDDPGEMSYWRDLERRIDTARISTIDSFCKGLLREHALALGLDPDFSVLADAESVLFQRNVVSETFLRLLDAGDDAAQRIATEHGVKAVSDTIESMLNQAGLMERIARGHPLNDAERLMHHWSDLVEKEQAARIMRLQHSVEIERFQENLARFEGECTKSTDGRECMRLEMIRLLEAIRASDSPEEIEQHLANVLALKATGTRKANWSSERVVNKLSKTQELLKELISEYEPVELDPEVEAAAARLSCDLFTVYSQVERSFRKAKADRASLDFSDLLRETVRMLEEEDALRAWTASGIKYLLIDEFQDTNAGQLALAKGLMALGDRAGAELFVVGDAKQSIYKFRGAEVEVFDMARELAEETIPLDVNYRSLPEVMGFINAFFRQSRALEAVESDYKGMQTHRAAVDGPRVEFLIPEEDADANSDALRNLEAELIANRIAALCGPGDAFVFDPDLEIARPAEFGDVAVLFRRGTHIETYAQVFTKLGINCHIVEGAGFYKKQEIADFRNLLQTVLDPWDETALAGFLRSPIAALKDETLMELCLDKGLSEAFASTMAVSDEEENLRLNEARELVRDLREHVEIPLPAFLRHALIETSYEAILLSGAHGVQKASNVRKLVDIAADFAHSGPARLRTFTRYLADLAAREFREGEAELFSGARGAVKLMTVHKSKGLEFPIVVIADTAQGTRDRSSSGPFLFHRRLGVASKIMGPGGDAIAPRIGEVMKRVGKDEDRAEEARILYVAMTRARDWLLIGGSPKPGKGSWFRLLDDTYALTGRTDGDAISGDGWQAVLRRKPGDSPRGVQKSKKRPLDTVDMLVGRAARLATLTISRENITISRLLDLISPEEDNNERATYGNGGQELDAMLRGTMIHRLLELWDFASSNRPPVREVIAMECPAIRSRSVYETNLNEAMTCIEGAEFFAQLQQATAVQKEVPFLFRMDDTGIIGTIDALLPDGTIVDYKTGSSRPERHRRYETQLRLYAAALQAIEGTAPLKGVLFYIDTGETYEVDLSDSLIEESIADARKAIRTAIA